MNIFTRLWKWLSYKPSPPNPLAQRLPLGFKAPPMPETHYKHCTNCGSLINKRWLYEHCWTCCFALHGWNPERLAAAGCEVEWKEGPQIGEIIKVRMANPLPGSQWYETMGIDLYWKPPSWHLTQPDAKETRVFLCHGDPLTIISRPMQVYECQFLIFKVRDKENHEYYLSSQYLTTTPKVIN